MTTEGSPLESITIEDGEICDDYHNDNGSKKPSCPTNNHAFDIVFSNNSKYEIYGDKIIKILEEHLLFDGKKLIFSTTLDAEATTGDGDAPFAARIQAFELGPDIKRDSKPSNEIIEIDDSHDSDNHSSDSQDFGEALNSLFTIDPSPSTSLESARVPSYKRAVKEFLDDKIPERKKKDANACVRPKHKMTCFNCGSTDHGLRACHLPRNAKRIFLAKKARATKLDRYHVDVDQRFSHLRPGIISNKLRKALRLRSGEIPSYVYKMRIYGYPPGWLEDAKVAESGLSLFNSGDDVLKSEEISDSPEDIKYDISKIIEYPGFNVSPGSKFYDDYKHHNVPPLNRCYMKDEMIKALGNSAIQGFKRRKISEDVTETNPQPSTKSSILATDHDMEIEDADVSLSHNIEIEYSRPMPPPKPPKDDNVTKPPPPPPSPSESPAPPASPLNDDRSESPTLDELQARQRALLLKLESGDDTQTDDDSLIDSNSFTDNFKAPVTPSTPATPKTPIPTVTESKKIKSSHMGTPVLQFSPFEKLPAGENFKVGVSDVINFENLPDSTGKYESMKDVLKKVRNIKQRLIAEDICVNYK